MEENERNKAQSAGRSSVRKEKLGRPANSSVSILPAVSHFLATLYGLNACPVAGIMALETQSEIRHRSCLQGI